MGISIAIDKTKTIQDLWNWYAHNFLKQYKEIPKKINNEMHDFLHLSSWIMFCCILSFLLKVYSPIMSNLLTFACPLVFNLFTCEFTWCNCAIESLIIFVSRFFLVKPIVLQVLLRLPFQLATCLQALQFWCIKFFVQEIKKVLWQVLFLLRFLSNQVSFGWIYFRRGLFDLSNKMHSLLNYWKKEKACIVKLGYCAKAH
jgi:hypothetical protein